MENIQNIIEYYDEFFVITESQKKFFSDLFSKYHAPVKILGVNVGTGLFELMASEKGHDVTGIDCFSENIRAASLRHRSNFLSLRFFQMESFDMARFLGKGFYNIIYNLNSKIIFSGGIEQIQEFLEDSFLLLSEGGVLVIECMHPSFGDKGMIQLPAKETFRAKLFTELWKDEAGIRLVQNIETGSGKILPVCENTRVCIPSVTQLKNMALETGFEEAEFFEDFTGKAYEKTSPAFVAVFKK